MTRAVCNFIGTMVGSGAALGLVAAFAATPAQAVDVFVVDAKGVDLPIGEKLDGSKALKLDLGQRVSLVTADGRTIKLKGPSNVPPAPENDVNGNDVVNSLKGMINARAADTTSAGIIRNGTASFTQPSPWLVEILNNGDRCLLAGTKTILWREDRPATANTLEITPADRSWTANAAWPSGSDRLSLPENLTLNDGQAYLVSLDGAAVTLTIHVIPATVKSDAAKAAWMIEVGCEPQAKAFIDAIH
jgi:hypothetical protein